MVKLTALFFIFIASSAFAYTHSYGLNIDLSLDGKLVSSPKMNVKEGQTASITQDSNGKKTFIQVVALEQPTNGKAAILMKFVVGTISSTGEKTILSTPQILTLENEKAEVSVGSRKESSDLKLSVIATRKSLKR